LQSAIKADPATAHIMVLQISAMYLNPEDRAIGLERGADTYLTEPVEPAELLGATKALLRLYERDQEKRFLLDQLREANRQNAAQLAELNSIYAKAPVGLAVLDTELRYIRVNNCSRRRMAYRLTDTSVEPSAKQFPASPARSKQCAGN
jgi:response regulator RpfG family c-di-GMP phosphodiesterase